MTTFAPIIALYLFFGPKTNFGTAPWIILRSSTTATFNSLIFIHIV